MRINNISNKSTNSIIDLKDNEWLEKLRVAGNIVANSLSILEEMVIEKKQLSLIDMNNIIENYIISREAVPTFKGYHGFPCGVCISVNKTVVHGIPNDYKVQDGDVVSFDLGATFEGAIADSAITCIFGTPKNEEHINLLKANNDALYAGIGAIAVGRQLGVIGEAINKVAIKSKFASIDEYGGHGIGSEPHMAPFVSNNDKFNNGIRIQEGLTIAIEPMFV